LHTLLLPLGFLIPQNFSAYKLMYYVQKDFDKLVNYTKQDANDAHILTTA